jgi:hypothetical protein
MEAAREDYEYAAPSVATDARQIATWARYLTLSASPGSAIAVLKAGQDTDIRAILPTIHVPTLVIAREEEEGHHLMVAR